MKNFLLLSLMALTMVGCAKKIGDPSMGLGETRATEGVPAKYRQIYEGYFGFRDGGKSREALPFESITLERTECYGTCPAYKVTFFRSGAARLEAIAHMPIEGSFESEIDIGRFARMCFALEKFGFASFKSDYRAPWTDDATCIITATTAKGSKIVSDYGEVGPIELWTIQSALDRTRQELHWKPAKKPNQSSESTAPSGRGSS